MYSTVGIQLISSDKYRISAI